MLIHYYEMGALGGVRMTTLALSVVRSVELTGAPF
eukprot:COSAG01_NODE_59581_length_299_cov_1.270000_1_plen_35_part_10